MVILRDHSIARTRRRRPGVSVATVAFVTVTLGACVFIVDLPRVPVQAAAIG
jgi:hypothetical protein